MNRSAKDISEHSPWQELTPGGEIYEGGTARLTITGEWRSNVPVWEQDKCKQCLLCAPFCPDASIPVRDGKRLDFDFDHCKGCGICANACPFGAIRMEQEVRA
ncbi:4Fe-4S binding protein [Pseudoflavonifractor sp. HCP28S3_F10]|uniref:4Fe-4S binding protein n=1 Tax=Pseudoflavonifractor sp. HCP28S3_F10 TaxID=3438947 RepID=UPI002A8CC554|nr:4Fe-4S binding protein [Clostridiales bacterium]MDY4182219.1 4Fe-4S binding protein [Pseudoflavonifractor sp.]